MTARALSKAGRLAWHAAHNAPGPGSNSNGKSQIAQPGPSRKVIFVQHPAQRLCAFPTGARHDAQRGGNTKSRMSPQPRRNNAPDGVRLLLSKIELIRPSLRSLRPAAKS